MGQQCKAVKRGTKADSARPERAGHRRASLVKSLKHVVERIDSGILPVQVCGLWLYGSFLRGKREPHDIDIVACYRKETGLDAEAKLIKLLLELIEEDKTLRNQVWNEAFEGSVDTIMTQLSLKAPGINDHRIRTWLSTQRVVWVEEARRFGSYSLYFSPTLVARKMLVKDLKHVQMVHEPSLIKGPVGYSTTPIISSGLGLRAKAYGLVWSETQRDIDANVKLLEAHTQEAVALEMPSLVEQVDELEPEYQMIKAGVSKLLTEIRKKTAIDNPTAVIKQGMIEEGRKLELNEKYIERIIWSGSSWGDKENAKAKPSDFAPKDVETVRDRLRFLTYALPFARALRREFSGINQNERARWARDPIIAPVFSALRYTPFTSTPLELRQQVLKDMGLDDIGRLFIVEESGPARNRYRLPENMI